MSKDKLSKKSLEELMFKTPIQNQRIENTKLSKFNIGDVINQKYEIQGILDYEHTEADIYLSSVDNEPCVIKIYRHGYEGEKISEILSKIDSPYVMKLIDYGYANGRLFNVYPYLKQGTMEQYFDQIDIEMVKNMIIPQLNEGLKVLHDAGIIHDDIKPHNLYFSDDKSHIIIGDFGISKMLKDKNKKIIHRKPGTFIYAAPEAVNTTSILTDYFSFGMTILHFAFPKYFDGLTEAFIRHMISNDEVNIPDDIDLNVADLICMLIKHHYKDRITYNGVKEWLNNPYIYGGQSASKSAKLINFQIKPAIEFAGVSFNNVTDLLLKIQNHWDQGIIFFKQKHLIQLVPKNYFDTKEHLIAIYNQYHKTNVDLGLFLSMHAINETLPIYWKNIYLGKSLFDVLEYLKSFYPHIDANMIEYDFFKKIAKSNQDIANVIEKLFQANISIETKRNMLLNYFSNDESFYFNNQIYNNIKEVCYDLLNEHGQIETHEMITSGILYDYLKTNLNIPETHIEEIIQVENEFQKFQKLFMLILGHPLVRFGERYIINYGDLLDYIELLHETQSKNQALDTFISSKNMRYFILLSHEENTLLTEVFDIIDDYDDSFSLHEIFYYFASEKKYFPFKSFKVSDLEQLANILSKSNNLEVDSKKLMNDQMFEVWLKAKGYKIYQNEEKKQ